MEEEEPVPPKSQPPRYSTSSITPPKLPDGEVVDLDNISRKRHEKDLQELQSLIDKHFEERKQEEVELEELRQRIELRKQEREEQNALRKVQEKERITRERVSNILRIYKTKIGE